ncbi:MAG: flippase-like domain-containing protein [Candidatus Woesearchaeota archaeon]
MKLKLIPLFIFGFIIISLIYSHFGLKDALDAFKKFTILPLIAFIIIAIIIDYLLTYRWKLILEANNIKINFLKIWQYRLSGFAIGYLSPQPNIGGDPIRAILLKKDKVKFKKALSTVIIDRSIQTLTDLIFAFIMILIIFFSIKISLKTKILLFLIVSFPLLIIIYYFTAMKKNKPFFSKLFKRFKKIQQNLIEIEKIISNFHRKKNHIFIKTLLINFLVLLLIIIQYVFILMLLNININIITIFLLIISITIASAVPLPMNMGALEISQITALSFLKIDQAIGLSISILIRFLDLTKTIIGLNSLFYFGFNFEKILKILKIKNDKKNNKEK